MRRRPLASLGYSQQLSNLMCPDKLRDFEKEEERKVRYRFFVIMSIVLIVSQRGRIQLDTDCCKCFRMRANLLCSQPSCKLPYCTVRSSSTMCAHNMCAARWFSLLHAIT